MWRSLRSLAKRFASLLWLRRSAWYFHIPAASTTSKKGKWTIYCACIFIIRQKRPKDLWHALERATRLRRKWKRWGQGESRRAGRSGPSRPGVSWRHCARGRCTRGRSLCRAHSVAVTTQRNASLTPSCARLQPAFSIGRCSPGSGTPRSEALIWILFSGKVAGAMKA